MPSETEYVLGTHDEEITRLGVQHRAWRPCALAAWRSAGIAPGQTILDVGCGPGYATLDLSEMVGPSGRVFAIDKSERFLNALNAELSRQKIGNVTARKADFDNGEFPDVIADTAWCRWVFAFLKRPREVLAKIAASIRPGGSIVIHEYFDYRTWRPTRPCPEHEEFVAAVMASWREAGGEPDIALPLLGWFEDLGFELRSIRPIIDIVQRDHPKWEWMRAFVEVGRQRLVDLGYLTDAQAESIWQAFKSIEAQPGARWITPAVLEIVASSPR